MVAKKIYLWIVLSQGVSRNPGTDFIYVWAETFVTHS